MKYTVQKLAEISGVSVRALHYYDQIGLLKPSAVRANGYREYEDTELLRLQQILFYRELEFPLEEIKEMLDTPSFNSAKALNDHKKLLEIKKKRLETLMQTIDTTLKQMQGGETIQNDDLYNGFSKEEIEKYKEEAKNRWGSTTAYKQSLERTKNWTKEDFDKAAKDMKAITQLLAMAMEKGIESVEAEQAIKKHRQYIEQFYDLSDEFYKNLATMYVNDQRFAKHYDSVRPGLAIFVRDAIYYYCKQTKKQNN